ncbi:histidine phosphatase family protein [Rhizobium sp. CRIBSB]|nr:histidine phosphatase family protein [Rhizobium sp. CRIBSB]
MLLRRQLLLTSLLALSPRGAAAADPWAALRAGTCFVLLRHATAPGTGDPPDFRIGDCSTQRNLSADGRAQALTIGDLFRANGIPQASIFSSQWCRCLETAALLRLGPVAEQPLLNSFFDRLQDGREQTDALRAWLASRPPETPSVLVTHQVNVTGLTSIVPASGDLVFTALDAGGKITVIGRQSAGA